MAVANWKTVRVFLSSTFRDMHAERDHLVKVVFPALRERLEKHRIYLVDIDLRWGVTREQVENDQVLELCLQQIDECRPFFLGILGERYGWVPAHYSADALKKHGWIGQHTGKSVTELEILHATLQKAAGRCRAFFYFRDPAALDAIPQAVRAELFAESDPEPIRRLEDLKEKIRRDWPVMEDYPARWVPGGRLAGLEAFGERVRDQLWQAIREDLSLPDRPTAQAAGDPLLEEEDDHERFMDSRLRVYVGGERTCDELVTFVQGTPTSPFVFGQPSPQGQGVCLVTGPSGAGKSAALARFVARSRQTQLRTLVVPHFVGASPRSTGLRDLLQRLCQVLAVRFGFADPVPSEPDRLVIAFREFLSQVPPDERVLLVIDALDQLDEADRAREMHWLPVSLPPNVKIVASCLTGPGEDERILEAFRRRPYYPLWIEPLDDAQRHEIIRQVPSLSAKTLDREQIDLLLKNQATTNPLFLLVALEELRGFGSFERLANRIAALPSQGDSVTALFRQVIERLETEFEREVVEAVLTLLACSRRGLSERELQELCADLKGKDDLFVVLRQLRPYLLSRGGLVGFYHAALARAVHAHYLAPDEKRKAGHRRLADYFQSQDYRAGSPEERLRTAQRLCFPPSATNRRKVEELFWQRFRAGQLDECERLLTDLEFIRASCAARMAHELVADYQHFQGEGVRLGPPIQTAWVHEGRLGVLCPSCLARFEIVPASLGTTVGCAACGRDLAVNPFSIALPWQPSPASQSPGAEGSGSLPSAGPSVRAFGEFIRKKIHVLENHPDLTLQEARNWGDGSAVQQAAAAASTGTDSPWLRWLNKASQQEQWVLTISGHARQVTGCAFSPDGRTLVSATQDSTLKVWDLLTRTERATLLGHERAVEDCVFSPDGQWIASASDDETLRIWDSATGQVRAVLRGHSSRVSCCGYSPDGRLLVSGSWDNTLRVWDAGSGQHHATFQIGSPGDINGINFCSFSPDGRQLLSLNGNWDWPEEVRVWDLASLRELGTLQANSSPASVRFGACGFSPDGQRLFALIEDGTLRAWDAATLAELGVVATVPAGTSGLVLSPDGRRAITSTEDGLLTLWDAQTGERLGGGSGGRMVQAFSPDGRLIVATSEASFKVWEVAAMIGQTPARPHSAPTQACVISPDGNHVLHASGAADQPSDLEVLDARTGECLATLWSHEGLEAPGVATAHAVLGVIHHCAWAPDGSQMMTVGGQGDGPIRGELRFWDARTRTETHRFIGHKEFARACAYSPDGVLLAAGFQDGAVKIWNNRSLPGSDPVQWNRWNRKVIPALLTLQGRREGSGNQRSSAVLSCAYSPDGWRLAVGLQSGAVVVWNAHTGEMVSEFSIGSGDEPVTAIHFSSDGRLLAASTSLDEFRSREGYFRHGAVHVLDARTGRQRFALGPYPWGFVRCQFTPDSTRLVVASQDGITGVIDLESRRVQSLFATDAGVSALAVGRAGGRLVVGDRRGQIWLLEVMDAEMAPVVATVVRLYRPGLSQWNEAHLAKCDWCGAWFSPPAHISDTVAAAIRNCRLAPEEVPCFALPEKAWNEPGLLADCPHCSRPLRFNPFLVDFSERY